MINSFIKNAVAGCLAMGLVGVAHAAPQKPVLLMKVYGLYCKTCFGGAKSQILRLPNVSRVDVFFKNQMVAVYPKGNVNKLPYSKIKGVVGKSSYKLKGMWVCKKPTTNLSSCKKI